jgi:hypothetical protein
MLSKLRKGLIYPVSTDITEHDIDTDAETWTYDDREVFRGNVDPDYLSQGLNVYWLYDDYNIRVGLAEHEQSDPNQFIALWYRENPFATMFQDDRWVGTGDTLWSKMSPAAYDDCMRKGIENLDDLIREYPAMKTKLVTPGLLRQAESWCATCCRSSCEKNVIGRDDLSVLFVDDSFEIYNAPMPLHDDEEQIHLPTSEVPLQEQEQVLEQVQTP